MDFESLRKLYDEKRRRYGSDAVKHISELLEEAKGVHKKDWQKAPTASGDHEQSWRAFKGKNLEKLIIYIIREEVEKLGLSVIEGNTLERTTGSHLSHDLNEVKRNLLVDYGEFGAHLPDVDIIIYNPANCQILAVISSKVTLRERIAQTGYWKIKLGQDRVTKHIKVFFITPDEDGTLISRRHTKKGRAIVEMDTDGSYVMSKERVEESAKVKNFDRFFSDLKELARGGKK